MKKKGIVFWVIGLIVAVIAGAVAQAFEIPSKIKNFVQSKQE